MKQQTLAKKMLGILLCAAMLTTALAGVLQASAVPAIDLKGYNDLGGYSFAEGGAIDLGSFNPADMLDAISGEYPDDWDAMLPELVYVHTNSDAAVLEKVAGDGEAFSLQLLSCGAASYTITVQYDDADIGTLEIADLVAVDKSALDAEITIAGTKKVADYTAASWADLQTALSAANDALLSVAADNNQAAIDAALFDLTSALDSLVAWTAIPTLPAIGNKYIDLSTTNPYVLDLTTALSAQEEALNGAALQWTLPEGVSVSAQGFVYSFSFAAPGSYTATLGATDTDRVIPAKSGNFVVVNKAALLASVLEGRLKLDGDYTLATKRVFEDALDKAEIALEAIDAANNQAKIDDAKAKLDSAIQGLNAFPDWSDYPASAQRNLRRYYERIDSAFSFQKIIYQLVYNIMSTLFGILYG